MVLLIAVYSIHNGVVSVIGIWKIDQEKEREKLN